MSGWPGCRSIGSGLCPEPHGAVAGPDGLRATVSAQALPPAPVLARPAQPGGAPEAKEPAATAASAPAAPPSDKAVVGDSITLPIGTFTTGLIIGLVKAKREWK